MQGQRDDERDNGAARDELPGQSDHRLRGDDPRKLAQYLAENFDLNGDERVGVLLLLVSALAYEEDRGQREEIFYQVKHALLPFAPGTSDFIARLINDASRKVKGEE
jgi:hypothetical protein